MQAEAAAKGGSREAASRWNACEPADQHPHPDALSLIQSLRFYVAHANAENRSTAESPQDSEFSRYPAESRTAAAAAAAAADKEDHFLQLIRGYGCAVILANLITTFIFSSEPLPLCPTPVPQPRRLRLLLQYTQ
ncbi:hypothetical protein Efla_006389 [Eimeria flavescens]